jgi:hypothetical protein
MVTSHREPTLPREAMPESLESIKLELVSEYEESAAVDIGGWIQRYPEHRMALLTFWAWLRGTPRLQEDGEPEPNEPLDEEELEFYRDSLRDACLAVTLGDTMLTGEGVPAREELAALATDLERCRSNPPRVRKRGQAFAKAVVYTWIVSSLEESRPRVTRLATQKVVYLLEHAMSLRVFGDHDRKPLGPYDYKSRYKDAEPLAKKKRWLVVSGAALKTGGDLTEMKRYLGSYVRSAELAARFVAYVSQLSDEELETVATVHWCARELKEKGDTATVATVCRSLADASDWKGKLERPNFSEQKIGHAIEWLRRLRLIV